MKMENVPRVSVVISTYNHAWCLDEAIRSILNQTFRDFELVVLDDGSTDGTAEILKKFQQDERLRCFFEIHNGASAARNKGIEKTHGQYVAFLDSDDIWLPNKLERQVSFLDEHQEIALVHGSVEMIDLEGRFLPKETSRLQSLYRKAQRRGEDYVGLSEAALIFSSAVLFRKECLDQAGYLDLELESLQDLDLYLRIAFQGGRIGFLGGSPVARYRYRGSVDHTSPARCRSYLKIFQKQITLLEKTNQASIYPKAYKNFLLHMANFYYALGELGHAREFSLRAVRFNPKCFFQFSTVRNILMSFISVRILRFFRDVKSAFVNGILPTSEKDHGKKCIVG